jgi:lipoyl synthase
MAEAENDAPSAPRPSWLKVRRLDLAARETMQRSLIGLHTVCAEANCPNIGECWARGTATFMIMGHVCTRNCRFCDVTHGRPGALDADEPYTLAETIFNLGLKYAVITCVDRDDLPDQGAAHWAACIQAIRERCGGRIDSGGVGIEVLTGDFHGREQDVATVVRAQPDVFAHNVETVPRLQRPIRRIANWEWSTQVLIAARNIAQAEGIPLLIKSGMMLGLGETDTEVREAMRLLLDCGVDLLTLGQYLKPRNIADRLEVDRFVPPEQFDELAAYARELGFRGVAASPLTRSSHLAETLYANAVQHAATGSGMSA